MKDLIFLIVISLALIISSCSAPAEVAGGSDNPDFKMGIVISSVGTPAAGARVVIAPANYNPLSPGNQSIQTVVSDSRGKFKVVLPVEESLTITVYQSKSNERAIRQINSIGSLDTIKMDIPSAAKIYLPDSLKGKMAYFPGTTISFPISGISTNGVMEVSLDTLPAGNLQALRAVYNSKSMRITPDLTTVAGETAVVPFETDLVVDTRPVWKISTIVGVQASVRDSLGGEAAVRQMLKDQFARVSKAFSDSRLNGKLTFNPDSIFFFTGTVESQYPIVDGYSLRILFSGELRDTISSWNYSTTTIIHNPTGSKIQSLFDLDGDRSLMRSLGVSRGCFDRREAEILSSLNSLNRTGYTQDESWLNGRGEKFTSYDITVLNYNTNKPTYLTSDPVTMTADTIGVLLTDSKETALANQSLTVYLSSYGSRTVNTTPYVVSIKTNSEGIATIGYRVFSNGGNSALYTGSLLIKIDNGSSIKWEWVPFDRVSFANVSGQGSRYNIPITIY